MFELPEDPARKELEKMIKLSRDALGPMNLADVHRLSADEPWRQLGLNKMDWEAAQGLNRVREELERAAGKDFQSLIDQASGKITEEEMDRLTGKTALRDEYEKLVGGDLRAIHKLRDEELLPAVSMYVPDPDPFRHERERQQRREEEAIELHRRSTAVLEEQLRDAKISTLAAQERELASRKQSKTETRRWQIMAFAAVAGLILAAVSALVAMK